MKSLIHPLARIACALAAAAAFSGAGCGSYGATSVWQGGPFAAPVAGPTANYQPNYAGKVLTTRRWAEGSQITWAVVEGADSHVPGVSIEREARLGVESLRPALGSHVTLQEADLSPGKRPPDIAVHFVSASSLSAELILRKSALWNDTNLKAITWTNDDAAATGIITHADIYADRSLLPLDMRHFIAHEMSHALGIAGHSDNKNDLMYADVPALWVRVPSQADVNTLAYVYR